MNKDDFYYTVKSDYHNSIHVCYTDLATGASWSMPVAKKFNSFQQGASYMDERKPYATKTHQVMYRENEQ